MVNISVTALAIHLSMLDKSSRQDQDYRANQANYLNLFREESNSCGQLRAYIIVSRNR